MDRRWKKSCLVVLLALSGCASGPDAKGPLTSGEVETLMARGVVKKFEASMAGSYIVLDNGDVFRVDLPAMESINEYLKHRRSLGQPASLEME